MPSVLIVDNNAGVRRAVRAWVQFMGWDPLEAHNGELAAGLYQESSPDAVVCDLEMQPGDGLWFLGRVHATVQARGTVFLFLSAPPLGARAEAVAASGYPLFPKAVPGVGMPEVMEYIKAQLKVPQPG